METNFKSIYFTALDKQRELGEVVSNQDVKDCLDYAVNQEFWNMSEGFQKSLSNLLFKEYRDYTSAKEELKEKRLKSLEKARLVKALKRAQEVKESAQEGKKKFISNEDNKELLKQLDMALNVIQNKSKKFQKKSINEKELEYDKLVQVNGRTYKLLEEV